MAIEYQILGEPGRDNALLVTVDSGQSLHRLLFDCGEGCLTQIPVAHIQDIEAVFFSHFHVNHIAGFDTFLRMNWCRPERLVRIFGPPAAIEVLHHRLLGYTWNLVDGVPGEWLVTELDNGADKAARFVASEGFATPHFTVVSTKGNACYRTDRFESTVFSCTLQSGSGRKSRFPWNKQRDSFRRPLRRRCGNGCIGEHHCRCRSPGIDAVII